MNPQVGTDQIPPVKLLPGPANVTGSILVDTTLYAATTGNCPGVANGVWAVDLASDAKTVTSYDAKGAAVVGTAAPTFGTDGTIYIATGAGSSPVANSIVSLASPALTQKDSFTAGGSPFTSNPIVFQYKGKDLIVAANKDGRLYVLDSASLGGSDHKTPLSKSSQIASGITGCGGPDELAGRCGDSLGRPDDRKSRERRHEVRHGQRRGHQGRDRGVYPRRSERRAGASTAVGVTRSRNAGDAGRGQRRGVCARERRSHRARSEARRRPCFMRSTRQRARNSGRAARQSRRRRGASAPRPATARSTW